MRSSEPGGDRRTDAYTVLGVKPRASIQEARVAWLRLVKELHPDAGFDDPAASEHLKAINLAYQTLKDLEQGHTVGNAERRTFRSARATFVIFLFLPIVAAALIMGTRTDLRPSSVAPDTVATTNQERQIDSGEPTSGSGEARDTDEKRLIASQAHESDNLGARATGARDQSGQAADPTGRLGNEPRGDLAMRETGAAADRAERKGSKTVGLEDLNAHSSDAEPNAQRALAALRGAEREQGNDDAAWSDAQRGNTKGAIAADLTVHSKGSHVQTARPRIAELESSKETRPVTAAAIKSDKQGARSARPSTSVAQSEFRWPSADEPFVGADGRIR
jgi:hypothetical protein